MGTIEKRTRSRSNSPAKQVPAAVDAAASTEHTLVDTPVHDLKRGRIAADYEPTNGTATDSASEEDDDWDEQPDQLSGRVNPADATVQGLYLETVDRTMLDFDFEKLCSVSLSNHNVYGCLVCGKYFQGRGKSSHAYYHSMNENHHVFINLQTLKTYILPEGYEVHDASLNDIKHVIRPTFSNSQIAQLDTTAVVSYDLNSKVYVPGYVGLNNIKANDYINVVVQSLAHVKPVRDYFLHDIEQIQSELVAQFGLLVRKIWNPRAFKGQVSPHELLQEVSNASHKRFRLSQQSDPSDFLSWFINALHRGLGGSKKQTIIQQAFQGELQIELTAMAGSAVPGREFENATISTSSFWFLSLDLPPPPLFVDEANENAIPQVPLTTLLSKYDGQTSQEAGKSVKRYIISKLPQYLILCVKRFGKNNWNAMEKNPTIVNFPIKNLDVSEYCIESIRTSGESTKYDLIANICHDGQPGSVGGAYKVHLLSKAKDQWLQIQDLFVEEIMAQMIILSESCIQIWERIN